MEFSIGVFVRRLFALVLAVLAMQSSAIAGTVDYGQVTIINILAGARHGAMIQVAGATSLPNGGYLCLDPDAEFWRRKKANGCLLFY
jgi:hypothetical protein